jgi:exodeoxyribonuclease V beta subunit
VSSLDPLAIPLRGTVLVEASAGTGKTFTLSNLYLRLVVEAERGVGQILVVTYTNAATAELRSRIRDRLRIALLALRNGPAEDADEFVLAFAARRTELGRVESDARRLEVALRSFDEAAIFTIHGFCQRMLIENAFESVSTFDAELVADQRPLCRELALDHWVRALHDAPAVLVDHIGGGKQTRRKLEQLQDLVAKAVAHPDVPVLPERSLEAPHAELEEAVVARRTALAEAGRIWTEAREDLVAYLTNEDVMNQNQYRAGQVRTVWAPSLDDLFSDPESDPPLYDKVKKLTPTALAGGVLKGRKPWLHPFFDACEALCAAEREMQRWLEECALRFRLSLVTWARSEARRRHEAANAQSFDDLLHRLRDALYGPAGDDLARRLRERFPAALVDEFQDTDPVQYAILRSLYREGPGPLLLIGDPKQAIYAFRGADVFAYLRARDDAGNAPHTLETNHRSDPALVCALNTLFGRVRSPFLLDGIPYVEMRSARATARLSGPGEALAPLELLFLPRTRFGGQTKVINKEAANEEVPRLVAAEIARLLSAGLAIGDEPLRPGDVAVLCRTNRQARLVQDALRARGIPSVRQGDDSVFDADEANELEQVLRAIAEPGDASRLRCALATGVIGLDAAALRALSGDEDGWDHWAALFRSWHDAWLGRGFMAAFRRLLDDCAVAPRLLGEDGGERALTNLLHLAELLQAEAMHAHRGPLALVDWLALMRSDLDARQQGSEAAEVRLESDAHAVQLTTVHRSKGLEYGVVYCPFLWDGNLLSESDKQWVRFHEDDRDRSLCFDIDAPKSDGHLARRAIAEREALAESLRLLYVALTRARYRCTIVWGGISKAESSPLAYLLHQAGALENGAGDDLATYVRERFPKLGDAALRAELDALAVASGGRIAVREPRADEPPAYRPEGTAARSLECRTPSRELSQSWRMSSFSALVATRDRLGQRAEEGVDHDAQDPVDAGETMPAHAGARTAAALSLRVRLDEFPGGARAGQLVHDVFEHLDFTADDAQVASLIEKRARRHRLPKAALAPLGGAIRDVLEAPLAGSPEPLRLASIETARTLREMSFTMPVAQTATRALEAGDLARAFETLGSPAARAYAPVLRRIGFPELRGYLTGVIDLVLEHDGRWWVIDYKSNHLGAHAEDYAPHALASEMARHHYVLQYHLYAVALHLHLMQRLAGYDYDRDVAGVLYLFVRGISPRHPAGTGVFQDRPSRALIDHLAGVLGGRS